MASTITFFVAIHPLHPLKGDYGLSGRSLTRLSTSPPSSLPFVPGGPPLVSPVSFLSQICYRWSTFGVTSIVFLVHRLWYVLLLFDNKFRFEPEADGCDIILPVLTLSDSYLCHIVFVGVFWEMTIVICHPDSFYFP